MARFQETRAIIQAVRDGEEGEATRKSFEAYRRALMPFLAEEERKEEKRLIQTLHEEVTRGGLRVQPVGPVVSPVGHLRNASQIKDPHRAVGWKRRSRW